MLTEQERQLFKAVEEGNIAKVKKLVEGGASVRVKDSENRPLVYLAAQYGFRDIVEYLVTKGVDVSDAIIGAKQHGFIDIAQTSHRKM